MKITNADDFNLNKYNSVFITGEVGSGKHYLFHKLVDRYMSIMKPDEIKFAIFDMKFVDFDEYENNPRKKYVYKNIERGGAPIYGFDRLEELAQLSGTRSKNNTKNPMIIVYLEECDMARYRQDKFDELVIAINKNATKANMKLIYSTSNTIPETISKKLLHSFDLILSGNREDYPDYLGVPNIELEQYSFVVNER